MSELKSLWRRVCLFLRVRVVYVWVCSDLYRTYLSVTSLKKKYFLFLDTFPPKRQLNDIASPSDYDNLSTFIWNEFAALFYCLCNIVVLRSNTPQLNRCLVQIILNDMCGQKKVHIFRKMTFPLKQQLKSINCESTISCEIINKQTTTQ